MTNSTQEHYLDYIDILESLQRWLAYHTNSVQTYRRDGTHQLKPFETYSSIKFCCNCNRSLAAQRAAIQAPTQFY